MPSRIPPRAAASWGWIAAWLLGGAACAPAAAQAPRAPTTVSLRIRAAEEGGAFAPNATVTIDGELLGAFDFVAAHGVALPPGVHQVTVEAGGFFPWDRQVEARPGSGPIELEVVLTPVPD